MGKNRGYKMKKMPSIAFRLNFLKDNICRHCTKQYQKKEL